MRAHGYLAQTFNSGAALLSSNSCARTDCLIADVQMPNMTGLELHGQLTAAGMPIPTILITAHADEAVRSRAIEAGILGYLTKPVGEDDLLRCIRSALARRDASGRRQ